MRYAVQGFVMYTISLVSYGVRSACSSQAEEPVRTRAAEGCGDRRPAEGGESGGPDGMGYRVGITSVLMMRRRAADAPGVMRHHVGIASVSTTRRRAQEGGGRGNP
jgi:hypothetical protein